MVSQRAAFFWDRYRVPIAFLVSPLFPGVLFALFVLSNRAEWRDFLFFVELAALMGYPIAFLIGVPLYFLLKRLTLVRLITFLIAGSVLGLFSVLGVLTIFFPLQSWGYPSFLLGSVMGSVATGSFWLIARPDRDVEAISADHAAKMSSPE